MVDKITRLGLNERVIELNDKRYSKQEIADKINRELLSNGERVSSMAVSRFLKNPTRDYNSLDDLKEQLDDILINLDISKEKYRATRKKIHDLIDSSKRYLSTKEIEFRARERGLSEFSLEFGNTVYDARMKMCKGCNEIVKDILMKQLEEWRKRIPNTS